MLTRPQSGFLADLDPLSRWRLRVFGFKLLVLFPFAMLLAARDRFPLFATISSFACWYGFFSGVVALFRREEIAGPSLNGWDELLAFFALKYIAQFISAIIG